MEWGTRSLEREQQWAGSAPAREAAAAMGQDYSPAACSESTVSHPAGDQRRSVCLEFSSVLLSSSTLGSKSRAFGPNYRSDFTGSNLTSLSSKNNLNYS